MFNFAQLTFIIPLNLNELVHVLDVVLALQGVDIVQAFVHSGKFGRVIVQSVHNRAHFLSDILEIDQCRLYASIHPLNIGEIALCTFQALGYSIQALKDAVFLAIEVVFNTPQCFLEFGDIT